MTTCPRALEALAKMEHLDQYLNHSLIAHDVSASVASVPASV